MLDLPDEQIERFWPDDYQDILDIRRAIQPYSRGDQAKAGFEFVQALWPDQLERISKTSFILTKNHGLQLLKPNYAQVRFYEEVVTRSRNENRPIRAVVLKARQLGMSTFIKAWEMDELYVHPHRIAITLSYDDDSTAYLFNIGREMFRWHLFPRPTDRDATNILTYGAPHSSRFYAKTAGAKNAGRSFTAQYLHCSEVPMWESADEVFEGLLAAVPETSQSSIMIESTAKGASGSFYDTWVEAERGDNYFIPFFAPWTWDDQYQTPFTSSEHKRKFIAALSPDDRDYMHRHNLSPERMLWRHWKIKSPQCRNDSRVFDQEFPISPQVAFLSSGMPVFRADKVMALYNNTADPSFVGEIMALQ